MKLFQPLDCARERQILKKGTFGKSFEKASTNFEKISPGFRLATDFSPVNEGFYKDQNQLFRTRKAQPGKK